MYHLKPIHDFRLIIGLTRHFSATKKSHYDVLHLSRNCSDKEIKNAFIALSKELHPDKNKDQNAQKLFIAVLEAYNVLSKPSSRAQYDRTLAVNQRTINVYPNRTYRGDDASPNMSFNEFVKTMKRNRFSKYQQDILFWYTINLNRLKHNNFKYDPSADLNSFRQQQQQQYYHFYNDTYNWKKSEKAQNSSYYGVSGVKKMPNYVIILMCFAVTVVGTVFQIFVIRELYVIHKRQSLERSKHLSEELEKVRSAAINTTNDVRTQLLLEKIVKAANPSAATATLGQSLVTEK